MLFQNPMRIITQIVAVLFMWEIAASAADRFQSDIPAAVEKSLEDTKAKQMGGQQDEALTDLRLIVKEHPDYYRAVYNLGLAMADASGKDKLKLDEAISVLERARNIRDQKSLKDYSIDNSLGWYYAQANRNTDAERAYLNGVNNENLNTPDTNRRLYTNLGIFYLERGDLDQARKYLQIAADTYQSDSARRFLEINESVRKKLEVPEGLTYQAKLSDQDKMNSKGVRFVDDIRQKEGAQMAVLETLLQDRANFYHYNKRDKEDQPSPGLESTGMNRAEFLKRDLKFVGITADECVDQQPVVKVSLTKDSVQVSKPDN